MMSRCHKGNQDRLALAVLGVLALAFWGNCLWGGKVPVAAVYQKYMLPWAAAVPEEGQTRQWDSLLWDSMAQFYPWRLLMHRAAQRGQLPLWNPHQFCGYPFVGNGQSALFYPPNWLYFLIHPRVGLGLSAALHYFLGGLFVFGLGRYRGLSTVPALFAALAFTYGGFMVTWIELPTLVNSLIWLPLAWWGIEVICGGRCATPSGSEDEKGARSQGRKPWAMLLHPFGRPRTGASPAAGTVGLPAVSGDAGVGNAAGGRVGLPAVSGDASVGDAAGGTVGLPAVSEDAHASRTPEGGTALAQGGSAPWGTPSPHTAVAPKGRLHVPPSRGFLMLACALGMTFLAGHFQIAAYVWIFSALYALVRLPGLLRRRPAAGRGVALMVAGVAVGGLLASVQLLPTLELGRYSARGAGGPSAEGFAFHRQRALQPIELLTLLDPDFFGSPVTGDYRGISYSEHCGFVGAVTLLLLPVGLIVGRRRRGAWLFAGLAVFALWGAMAGPPAQLLYWGVPKLGQAGGFPRLLSVWTLAAALAAACGLQAILEKLSARRSARTAAAVPHAVGALALLLLVAQLLPWAYRFNPRADTAAVYPETEAITRLRAAAGEERYLALNSPQVWTLLEVPSGALLPPNAATVYGLHACDGYDSLFPAAYRAFAARVEGADPSPLSNGNMLFTNRARPQWPATCLLKSEQTALSPQPRRWRATWTGEGCTLYRKDFDALSRHALLLTESQQRLSSEQALSRVSAPQVAEGYGSLAVSFPAPGEPAQLEVRESVYPGWQLYLDGRRGYLLVAERWWQAALQGGETQARLVYYPAGVVAGMFVSLLALAVLSAAGTLAVGGRKKP